MNVVMADESGFAGDGYFAMAGYVAETDVWTGFNELWDLILRKHGIEYFHMKDFAGRRELFTGWDEPRRVALMADLLEAITAGPLFAIGACLKMADFERLSARLSQEGINAPYMACFHEMILGAGLTGATSDYPLSAIDFIYSRQDEFRKSMKRLWEFSRGYRDYGPALGILEFQDMRTVPGLQAADLLVYEFRHFYHLKDRRPDLKMRVPFRRLIEHQNELHVRRLKYLPGWLLELQANGLVEPGMHIISSDPSWDFMYQQLNPGFPDLKRDLARMKLLDKYIPFDPIKAFNNRPQ